MSKFTKAVKRGLEGLSFVSSGICCGCPDCQDAYNMSGEELDEACSNGEVFDEGSFSRSGCEICGSHLGGDRFIFHARLKDDTIIHFDGCVDCLMYIENGDEPDNWQP